jgi:hypothetical protein
MDGLRQYGERARGLGGRMIVAFGAQHFARDHAAEPGLQRLRRGIVHAWLAHFGRGIGPVLIRHRRPGGTRARPAEFDRAIAHRLAADAEQTPDLIQRRAGLVKRAGALEECRVDLNSWGSHGKDDSSDDLNVKEYLPRGWSVLVAPLGRL